MNRTRTLELGTNRARAKRVECRELLYCRARGCEFESGCLVRFSQCSMEPEVGENRDGLQQTRPGFRICTALCCFAFGIQVFADAGFAPAGALGCGALLLPGFARNAGFQPQ